MKEMNYPVLYEEKFDNTIGYSGYYVYYDEFSSTDCPYSDNGTLLA